MRFNYRKVSSIVLVVLAIVLTLSSAASAQYNYYGDNYYQSYDGPSESFIGGVFSGFTDSITDLLVAIPEMLLRLVLKVFNAPVVMLVSAVTSLLSEPIPTNLFYDMWKILVTVMSFFFTIILIFCGFNFITSGHDVEKREKAKQWLTQTIIMIIVIPLSYILYSWILEFSAGFTQLVLNRVSYDFLIVGEGSFNSLFLELFFTIPYSLVLLFTVILLLIRVAIVGSGVMLFPVGLLLYFIPPLREYGKLIINFLMVNIFCTFFIAVVLLTFSKIAQMSILSDLQVILAIAAFMLVNLLLIYVMFFAAVKAVFSGAKKVVAAVKVAKYFV